MSQLASTALTLLAATSTKKSSSSSSLILIVFVAIIAVVYFFFLRPQQQKAKAQRKQGTKVEVGDEILTVGGIVGRVLEINDDRITILTGEPTRPGEISEHPPHRMVIVRQGVARKLEPTSPQFDEELLHESADDAVDDDDDVADDGETEEPGDPGASDGSTGTNDRDRSRQRRNGKKRGGGGPPGGGGTP